MSVRITKKFFNKLISRNPFSTKSQLDLIRRDLPKLSPHHGRSLLWNTEDQEENKTSNFSPFFMCPAAINQTESARLVLELERYINILSLVFKQFPKNSFVGG